MERPSPFNSSFNSVILWRDGIPESESGSLSDVLSDVVVFEIGSIPIENYKICML